jgi:hypothetical protein
VSAGLPLRAGVTREDYNKLDDRKNRRKKRSLRMFINNQKRTPAAHNYAWKTVFQFIQDNNLLHCKFRISIRGSNFKLTQKLAQNLIRRHPELKILSCEAIDKAPHNGCKLKIKKRKKNKGKNRRRKQLVSRPTPLKKAPGVRLRTLPPASGADVYLLQRLMQDPQSHLMRTERRIRRLEKQAVLERHKLRVKRLQNQPFENMTEKYKKAKGARRSILPSQSLRQFKLRCQYFRKLKEKRSKQRSKRLSTKSLSDSIDDSNFIQSHAN